MKSKFMDFYTYVLPIPVFVLFGYLWLERTSYDYYFTSYVLFLPVLYGYIVPGIGTNILKMWRFKGKMTVGNYYIHHGFLYSAHMNFCLYLSFGDISSFSVFSLEQALTIIITAGIVSAYVLWLHDTYIVKLDRVEIYNPPAKEGKDPAEIVFYYAPIGFLLLGLTYSFSAVMAFQKFYIEKIKEPTTLAWLFFAGFLLMLAIPSIYYVIKDKRSL